jgi:hypothetical protein
LQQAINSAQHILQAQQVRNLTNFLKAGGDPVSQTLQLGDKKIDVPLMTIVPHNYLIMDDVEIKFKTRVGDVTTDILTDLPSFTGETLTGAGLQMQMDGIAAGDADVMEVTVRFRARESPEGMARIMDEYNKQI